MRYCIFYCCKNLWRKKFCNLLLSITSILVSQQTVNILNKLLLSIFMTCTLCGFLFTGGLLAGSLAIMTDAAHMLSDFAAFLISLFAIWVARWLPDKKRTFGYYRAGNISVIPCFNYYNGN